MGDERPSDAMQPNSKRRAGGQMTKDDIDDEEEEEMSHDPGSWKPVTDEAIKARRKVHVRRGGAPAPAAPEPEPAAGTSEPAATAAPASNPFAGITLAAPAAVAPASASGFAALSAPAAEKKDGLEKKADENKPEAASDAGGSKAATVGGFGALTSAGNPFAAISGSKPFGSGFSFGSSAASGFGALGATGSTFGSTAAGAEGSGGAATTSGFGSGGFNFGTGAFPAISGVPLGSSGNGKPGFGGFGGAGAGKGAGGEEGGEGADAGEGEGGEAGEGEGTEGMQLFGNAVTKPVVSLPEQEARTGEEEEKTLFSADGTLYEFDVAASKWRERGKGEFKVNTSDKGTPAVSHARMVMRQTGNLRLLLNATVYPGMPVQFMTGNVGVTFGVVNAAAEAPKQGESKALAAEGDAKAGEGDGTKPKTWALRIKSQDNVNALHTLLQRLRAPPAAGDNAV